MSEEDDRLRPAVVGDGHGVSVEILSSNLGHGHANGRVGGALVGSAREGAPGDGDVGELLDVGTAVDIVAGEAGGDEGDQQQDQNAAAHVERNFGSFWLRVLAARHSWLPVGSPGEAHSIRAIMKLNPTKDMNGKSTKPNSQM